MSKIFQSFIPGDHEFPGATSFEAADMADQGWDPAQIEAAKRGERVSDGSGGELVPTEVAAFVIVVTWDEPESGLGVHGPYGSKEAAALAWFDHVASEYSFEGELPPDVEHEIKALTT